MTTNNNDNDNDIGVITMMTNNNTINNNTINTLPKLKELPREIIIHILQFAIDGAHVIASIFNVSNEWREIIKDNDIWIHLSNVLDSEMSMTPIQTIVRRIKESGGNGNAEIFPKLQEYFQSLPYIQYIQLLKDDMLPAAANVKQHDAMVVFDPFSKLVMGDAKTFSEFIEVFGINSFNAFHSKQHLKETTSATVAEATATTTCHSDLSTLDCSAIMDTMGFDCGRSHGETIIQASFIVGDEPDEKWISAFLVKFNDKKKEIKEPPTLTCPALNITLAASSSSNEAQQELIEKMKDVISAKFGGKKSNFVCFEKVNVKRSKLFKISKKEETRNSRIKQLSKQKRAEFWFGNEIPQTNSTDSFFRFVKSFTPAV